MQPLATGGHELCRYLFAYIGGQQRVVHLPSAYIWWAVDDACALQMSERPAGALGLHAVGGGPPVGEVARDAQRDRSGSAHAPDGVHRVDMAGALGLQCVLPAAERKSEVDPADVRFDRGKMSLRA